MKKLTIIDKVVYIAFIAIAALIAYTYHMYSTGQFGQ
jgi:cell division protein FtsL